MKRLSSRLAAFLYKNRNKGVHNLMLYIGIANVIVYLLFLLNPGNPLFYTLLVFNRDAILRGQVWRIFTYPFVYLMGMSPFFGIISLMFYWWCGMVLEQYWGTLRFNIYYLSGVLLTAVGALLLRSVATVYYVNLSLLLGVATLLPNELIRIWFIIPVKMKWLALIDLVLTLIDVIRGIIVMIHWMGDGPVYLGWLLPIIALLNYILFFGAQVKNLLPDFIRYHPTHKSWKQAVKQGRVYEAPRPKDNARFRCTVCGRTELTNPGLEFRYCSKCKGYRCYCEDHINNHTHLTE